VDTAGALGEAKRRLGEEYERRMREAPAVLRRYAGEVADLVAEGANPHHAPFDAPSYTEKNAAEHALHYGPAVLYHLKHGTPWRVTSRPRNYPPRSRTACPVRNASSVRGLAPRPSGGRPDRGPRRGAIGKPQGRRQRDGR
jgi:hypothetical protein